MHCIQCPFPFTLYKSPPTRYAPQAHCTWTVLRCRCPPVRRSWWIRSRGCCLSCRQRPWQLLDLQVGIQGLFGMSVPEALRMDTQQRLLLELLDSQVGVQGLFGMSALEALRINPDPSPPPTHPPTLRTSTVPGSGRRWITQFPLIPAPA